MLMQCYAVNSKIIRFTDFFLRKKSSSKISKVDIFKNVQ